MPDYLTIECLHVRVAERVIALLQAHLVDYSRYDQADHAGRIQRVYLTCYGDLPAVCREQVGAQHGASFFERVLSG